MVRKDDGRPGARPVGRSCSRRSADFRRRDGGLGATAGAQHRGREAGDGQVRGQRDQPLEVTGIRRARYRGLPKVRLQHAFPATALNIIRLDAHWSTEAAPPALAHTSRLTRLSYRLTA
ncbi:IS5 family transposase [Streptacidiphilus sp. MAP12-16]|uniref:hypothetical protein n=1 Tax=Streptacidiphilus sp. MAP12-16 TaxID=3156300 RepID=UPI003517708F